MPVLVLSGRADPAVTKLYADEGFYCESPNTQPIESQSKASVELLPFPGPCICRRMQQKLTHNIVGVHKTVLIILPAGCS